MIGRYHSGYHKEPAGSEMEHGGEWILLFHSLCTPWYLQCLPMYESSKMCVIAVRFGISVFFPQRNIAKRQFHHLEPFKKKYCFLEKFAFPTRFDKSNVRCRTFSLFPILSCFRQFVSARLQQICVLFVGKSPLKRLNASRHLWGFGTQTARDGLLHLSHINSSMVPVCTDKRAVAKTNCFLKFPLAVVH